jgi:hypothetical protein
MTLKLITDMKHPSYSPSFAPNDFWLFPEIKSPLKGQLFQDTEVTALIAIPQQEFQKCFQQ